MPAAAGVVRTLWRYPVKSLLGERCERLALDARGVEGDRLYAIRDAAGGVPVITFPDGRRLRGDDATIHVALSTALGQPVTLAREAAISHLDAGPVHLLTTASLAWLGDRLPETRLDERRFRPNVLIDAPGARLLEREWLGRTLALGDVRLAVREPAERCVMVDFAQAELPEDSRVLRMLARAAGSDFGVYADVLVPGRVSVGDELAVL